MDMNELREQINQIDEELVKLFSQRMQVARNIAQYKQENNLPVYDPERERQVLHLYVNGYKSSEIGGILYMSVNTVETHKKRIKEKLNLTRKADLLAYAMENGLFEDWD